MENNDNELRKNDVRALLFELINRMSEGEMQQLLKVLEEGRIGERRQCDRKDFYRVIDYQVGDHPPFLNLCLKTWFQLHYMVCEGTRG